MADKYIITNKLGGRVREKRSTAEGVRVLKVLSENVIFVAGIAHFRTARELLTK